MAPKWFSFFVKPFFYFIIKIKLLDYQTNDICLFFLSATWLYSPIYPYTSPLLYSLTFISFYFITVSTSLMNWCVPYSDHSPSLNDIWFKLITSNDKFDIDFNKFLLSAYANYPLAAFLTLIKLSVYLIFCFNISMMPWYCYWIW